MHFIITDFENVQVVVLDEDLELPDSLLDRSALLSPVTQCLTIQG